MQIIKVAANTEPADTLAQRIADKLRAGGMDDEGARRLAALVEAQAEGNPAPLVIVEAGTDGSGLQYRFQAVDHVA
ncbi:MAG TPA: hypothetical protein VGU20_19985 [Stellaceae bacterium]|nr:hypothetical protein [Stellaceae bacterium]